MPDYQIQGMVIEIARNAVLIDSNVLIAAFFTREQEGSKDYALNLLNEDDDYSLLVPIVVVIEAWGMLVGRRGEHASEYEMLSWINTSNRATLVPTHLRDLTRIQQLVQDLKIDSVDAILADLATEITQECGLSPPLIIATFDTRDFFTMSRRDDLEISLLDMRSYHKVII